MDDKELFKLGVVLGVISSSALMLTVSIQNCKGEITDDIRTGAKSLEVSLTSLMGSLGVESKE